MKSALIADAFCEPHCKRFNKLRDFTDLTNQNASVSVINSIIHYVSVLAFLQAPDNNNSIVNNDILFKDAPHNFKHGFDAR